MVRCVQQQVHHAKTMMQQVNKMGEARQMRGEALDAIRSAQRQVHLITKGQKTRTTGDCSENSWKCGDDSQGSRCDDNGPDGEACWCTGYGSCVDSETYFAPQSQPMDFYDWE